VRPVLLSVLVPLYNEESLVRESLNRVLRARLPQGVSREIIVVDDASTDESAAAVDQLVGEHPGCIQLFRHSKNQGKGAALRTALEHASGDLCIFQDADLEYDPNDYTAMLQPLLDEEADAVFGSRFATSGKRRVLYFWHAVGNHALTTLCNMAADLNLTDMETCYKAVRTSLLKSIPLRSNRFGIEPELTIKLAQRHARVYEVPIRYNGRTYDEGKKIGLKDAFQAAAVIVATWLQDDIYTDPGAKILGRLGNTDRFNRWMASVVRPYLHGRTVEIGAGLGNLCAHLSRRIPDYVATDIEPEHLNFLRTRFSSAPNVSVGYCDLSNPSFFEQNSGQFESLVCLNVVEHVDDDMRSLKHIRTALKDGGRAVILVPEGPGVYGTLDEVLGHFRRYTEAELRSKLEASGFVVERMLKFNRVTRPGWWFNGRLLKRRTFGRFQLAVFDRMVWLWRRMDRVLPWGPVSLIAVARRGPETG